MISPQSALGSISGITMAKQIVDMCSNGIDKTAKNDLKQNRNRSITQSLYEHNCRCHLPHDPSNCEACLRARMMAKSNTSNSEWDDIRGKDKGYVYSMDYIGPYTPDIDGNIYGFVGVEVAHTNYGNITLSKNKEATTTRDMFKQHRTRLRTIGKDEKDIVRIHHDCDTSFKAEFEEYIESELIEDTNTGGYNPQANSRVERRNRSIKQAFKAALFNATAGLPYYNALWGVGLIFANEAVNKNTDTTGRNYYELLTGQPYKYNIGKLDLAFGQQVFYHKNKEQLNDDWETNGQEAIWVGRSNTITEGHIVVPIKWDPDNTIYELSPSIHVNHIRFEHIKYPLRMGPNMDNIDTDKFEEYIEEFFIPWYRMDNSDISDEQIEGEDPIWNIEQIKSHRGKGKKRRYLIKWENSNKMTYEPGINLTKYGAKNMVDQYEAGLRLKNKQKSTSKKKGNKKSGYHSKIVDKSVYYCTYSNSVIYKDTYEDAVKYLINKQNKEGGVHDWIDGYRTEMDHILNRRLISITDEEVSEYIRKNCIPMRMILEDKRDGRRKGRLVVIGCREPYHWDTKSNNSPVAELSTVRLLLYEAGDPNEVISNIDISVAFLQAEEYKDTDPHRYVSYKPHPTAKTRYYRLKGPIYGMRSASREWYDTISKWLNTNGYVQQYNEPCLFVNDKGFKVVLYVDDIICKGSIQETEIFYNKLKKDFDCKDENYLSPDNALSFLGFDISCADYNPEMVIYEDKNVTKNGKVRVIYMDQNMAVDNFLTSRDIKPNRQILSPMVTNKLIQDDEILLDEEDIKLYQSDIGVCIFFSITTRLLCYSLHYK